MPASFTSEYDCTGLTGSALYAKVKAALIESGGVVFDEYTTTGANPITYYLVEKVTIPGQAVGYARWAVTNVNISSPVFYPNWNATNHSSTSIGLQNNQSANVSASPYLRMFAGAGYRSMVWSSPNFGSGSPYLNGWFAPTPIPPGWDTTASPYVVAYGANASNANITILTGAQATSAPRVSATTNLYPTIDSLMTGSIARFPAFLGHNLTLHNWPDDFQVISGRTTTDFASMRDGEYTIMVGSEIRTYRPWNNHLTNSYAIRTS